MLPLLAHYVHALDPFVFRFTETVGVRWYGVSYVLSFLFGYLLYVRLARQGYSELPAAKVADFITMTALFGVILGGRIGHFLFYAPKTLFEDPLEFFRLTNGGMASHGGIAGIIIFTFVFARWQKISWTNLGDNLCVVSPLGLLLVRLANFINGELWGTLSNVAWAVRFPRTIIDFPSPALEDLYPSASQRVAVVERAYADPQFRASIAEMIEPRHPSQLYEAFFEGAMLFAILWFLRTRFRLPNGVITGAFFLLYAIFRIGCEYFRAPDAPLAGPFTRGQFLSLFMILIGAAFLFIGFKRQRYPREKPTSFEV